MLVTRIKSSRSHVNFVFLFRSSGKRKKKAKLRKEKRRKEKKRKENAEWEVEDGTKTDRDMPLFLNGAQQDEGRKSKTASRNWR